MQIGVYCSSAQGLAPAYYEAGEAFGRMLARRGHGLVYGGYDQGIMGAVARGVAAEGGRVTAVVPAIFEKPGYGQQGCHRVIHTETMHARKAAMEQEADALAVLPGGIGTYDEFFEAYVLKSLGQLDKPLAVYNWNGCCDALAALLADSAARGMLLDWLEQHARP